MYLTERHIAFLNVDIPLSMWHDPTGMDVTSPVLWRYESQNFDIVII